MIDVNVILIPDWIQRVAKIDDGVCNAFIAERGGSDGH